MTLVHVDTHQLVSDQMLVFIKNSSLTFEGIRKLLLNKGIIPSVQSKVIEEIDQLKDSSFYEVQQRLEQQAFKLQESEDLKEHEDEHHRHQKIQCEIITLKQELDTIPNDKLSHQKQCISIQAQLNELKQKKQDPKSDAIENEINALKKSLIEHEFKFLDLTHRQTAIEMKIHDLKIEAKTILNHELNRKSRKQARIGYNASTEGIFDTLSSTNSKQLKNNLHSQRQALDKKAKELADDAEKINYATFLDQLQHHLNELTISENEKEALKNIIKFMRLHLDTELEIFQMESLITNKRSSLAKQAEKLHMLQLRISELEHNKPKLLEQNSTLADQVKTLKPALMETTEHLKRLKISTWILLALSLLVMIPLLLYVFGWISALASTAISYALLASPPMLLWLTTVALGITTSVFYFKNTSLDGIIKSAEQVIDNNLNQIKKEQGDLTLLSLSTLPHLTRQITKDENIRDQLLPQLETKRLISREYFEKAASITPVTTVTGIFTKKPSKEHNIEQIERIEIKESGVTYVS